MFKEPAHYAHTMTTKARIDHDDDGIKRPIKSMYYSGTRKSDLVHTNSSLWPRSAIMRAVDHLRADDYKADRVEIFNSTTGKLHCVMRRKDREIDVLFRDDPKGKQYGNG